MVSGKLLQTVATSCKNSDKAQTKCECRDRIIKCCFVMPGIEKLSLSNRADVNSKFFFF